jgi:tetratricopeptide (TPR) repeat protein
MAYTRMAYDPWEIAPKERSATFVGHTVLLEQLLSAVGEQRGHGTVQHYLLLGPRGIGKTSILLTLRDRIGADPTHSSHWFTIQLREEEYFIRTLRDLLDLTLQALAADENLAEAADLAERVHKERDDEKSLAIAMDGLRAISRMHNKRILLLIDNFDRVFPATATGRRKKRSRDNEYRAFRKLLSTESFLMVIGASVRLFEEIATYDQAFFNFFCPIEIPPLSDDEIYELLFKCADMDENSAFRQNLHEIKDKVRAITYMTGGNPRLVLMLYDVLRQREMLPIVQALRETVGGLTPMLKHILDDMPRQQSKTLDALVRIGGTASPSSIARLARLPLNVVTAQLGRLKDARFVVVEGVGKGNPATYRLSDPMFRTWYQMRYLRPAGRRIELFVEFLRAWFSVDDRKRFLEKRWQDFQRCAGGGPGTRLEDISVGIEYYAASLEDERERQVQLSRLAEGMFDAGHSTEAARLMAEFEAPSATSESGYQSAGFRALGDRLSNRKEIGRAIEAYSEALKKDPKNVGARLRLGLALSASGNHERARMEFDIAATTPGISKDLLAQALVNRGITKGQLGDSRGEIADYTGVVELAGAPAEVLAVALVNRGMTLAAQGSHQRALEDFDAALALGSDLESQRSIVMIIRGIALLALGRRMQAILAFEQCLESKADHETVHRAFVLLTGAFLQDDRLQDAANLMARLHEIEPAGTPVERRLEVRITVIVDSARKHSLDVAAALLETALMHDPEDIRDRLGFLKPAMAFAQTGSEQVLANLPDRERDAAREIAVTLLEKESRDDREDPLSVPHRP